MEKIDTGLVPSTSPVSDAIRAGRQLWTVVIAEDPQTGEITQGGIEAQTRQALENLERALKAAGGSLADIVQVQVFLTDSADAAGVNRIYRQFFSEPYPVRATVVVKELLGKGLRVEMLATAVLPS